MGTSYESPDILTFPVGIVMHCYYLYLFSDIRSYKSDMYRKTLVDHIIIWILASFYVKSPGKKEAFHVLSNRFNFLLFSCHSERVNVKAALESMQRYSSLSVSEPKSLALISARATYRIPLTSHQSLRLMHMFTKVMS